MTIITHKAIVLIEIRFLSTWEENERDVVAFRR